MNKLIMSLSAFVFALVSFNVHAQNNGVAVGNPDSDNMLMIEQDYEVSPAPAPVNMPSTPAQPVGDTQPANLQPTNVGDAVVMENVSETDTPNSQEIDVNESEMDY